MFSEDKILIKRIASKAKKVDKLADVYKAMSDQELKEQTAKFRERLKKKESLNDLLPEAFAVAREASTRVLGMTPYFEQVMGAIILHEGNIAECKTGEGKTLMATMAVYLNALEGKGVHIITVNEYLAQRDADLNRPLYEMLGLTVGVNKNNLSQKEKRDVYKCDVVYTTHSEVGFDYLRDNLVISLQDRVLRGLPTAFIDEADSVLIDEARTPLIISGGQADSDGYYEKADKFVKTLVAPVYAYDKEERKEKAISGDYEVDQQDRNVYLRASGQEKAEKWFKQDNLYKAENVQLVHRINQALKANFTMEKDVDYIVRNNKIVIVDKFTGRTMEGRAFSEGLHQALEAKEGVPINEETATTATITYQNFFRLYDKLAGMTGTAKTEEEEFLSTYNMRVYCVPTHLPVIREDKEDKLYVSKRAKYNAIVKEIKTIHDTGRPILLGTPTVEVSEVLSNLLKAKNIPHVVLNAKQDTNEANIIAKAGLKGAVTIATNMAGRGTDIQLTDETRKLGGLYVIGAEKHESRRIDNQLRGRSGRQGDPGTSQFYISLEDDLLVRFGSDKLRKYYEETDDEVPFGSFVAKQVTSAQKRIEGFNFDAREQLLHYDDVLRRQREIIYAQRDRIMKKGDIHEIVHNYMDAFIKNAIENSKGRVYVDPEYLKANLVDAGFSEDFAPSKEEVEKKNPKTLCKNLQSKAWKTFEEKVEKIKGGSSLADYETTVILRSIDMYWVDHIDRMDKLKRAITLRSYAQENPLQQYVQEGYWMFEDVNENIAKNIVYYMNQLQLEQVG